MTENWMGPEMSADVRPPRSRHGFWMRAAAWLLLYTLPTTTAWAAAPGRPLSEETPPAYGGRILPEAAFSAPVEVRPFSPHEPARGPQLASLGAPPIVAMLAATASPTPAPPSCEVPFWGPQTFTRTK